MNARTSKALKGSINKWIRIARDTRAEDRGPANCRLCEEFYDNGCEGCPVSEKTGRPYCSRSPCQDWSTHQLLVHGRVGGPRVAGCAECLRCAKEERDFLIGLLPKSERAKMRSPRKATS
jgi:hypothetical protein